MGFAPAVEALLAEINRSLSTYDPESTLSRINASTDTTVWHAVDGHFVTIFQRSREIYQDTKGAFNPAVGPLVNAWGFGPENPETLPDEARVRELLKLVAFDRFEFRQAPAALRKSEPKSMLDFSAIAKGYGVDAIGLLLERRGVHDYLVEIGGEVRARGERAKGQAWRVGVAQPAASAVAVQHVMKAFELRNKALATSGTYRNYEVVEGKRIAHILNPQTGYPAQNSLLSVSVIAGDTMTADAYATALMVFGVDKGMNFVEEHEDIEAYFIADGGGGKLEERRSSGFPPSVDH
jgi:thiamine biosynthesis lipoprotein